MPHDLSHIFSPLPCCDGREPFSKPLNEVGIDIVGISELICRTVKPPISLPWSFCPCCWPTGHPPKCRIQISFRSLEPCLEFDKYGQGPLGVARTGRLPCLSPSPDPTSIRRSAARGETLTRPNGPRCQNSQSESPRLRLKQEPTPPTLSGVRTANGETWRLSRHASQSARLAEP